MTNITLKINDSYVTKVIEFLNLLPHNVVEIVDTQEEEFLSELKTRVTDIKSKKVKTISKEEAFCDI
ncbi:MAG: hypothetical protein WHU93_00305 [Arcobacteraceae bacterium]